MSEAFKSELKQKLERTFNKIEGSRLYRKYEQAFHTNYFEECTTDDAVLDITFMEKLSEKNPVDILLYETKIKNEPALHLRLYQFGKPIPLSDVLPMLENLGLRTFEEFPYHIIPRDNSHIFIGHFTVTHAKETNLKIDEVKTIFEEAFIDIYSGMVENDGFNKLVLDAELTPREIVILRAYAKYLHQIRFRFSQNYIEKALAAHPDITRDLVAYFKTKFSTTVKKTETIDLIEARISHALESVTSLDEDRILRHYLHLMKATVRTNYFQKNKNDEPYNYLSFKLFSRDIPELPLPKPLYEIFIYSPRFEGIHLRNTTVARGGIRWSDRKEDFRTEILGLMKAQVVKNAVIVPSGAKGGFVLKQTSELTSREALQQEVVFCYRSFISALLNITDNIVDGKTIHPVNVICYDDFDPYFVVAADKGTASFSDIANSISNEHQFWLGDAFASGGSAGYDHKKMGITARGAWESIKRHFCELGLNVEKDDFTVIGIGDMSGDVFGNGMLYTKHIKLIAAFDHRHIFLDPNPDPEITYKERMRLFKLPASSWEDFDAACISKGGGVYKRTAKSISLSPEIKKALVINENSLTPNELIRAILKAPVDLLYNGGIGTYVKASSESHAEAGDKTNEFTRINGDELRCRIVGEGGNLGFTQLGRIEYALNGGLINTDFIDNSAGVDCSDHEVNIKILLRKFVENKKLTEKARNQLLGKMTDEVAELVLQDNYNQAFALSYAAKITSEHFNMLRNYITDLETTAHLNRAVEYLPDDKKIVERKSAGQSFTRPELAILFAYTKIYIKEEILKSDIPEDAYLKKIVAEAFPENLRKNYYEAMQQHRLHREIIATQLSNQIVNEMGILFVYNLQMDMGASVSEILKAYTVASNVFHIPQLQKIIRSLDYKIPLQLQYELLHHLKSLVTISTRWFLRNNRLKGDLAAIIEHFSTNVKKLETIIPTLMVGATKQYMTTLIDQFVKAGLSKELAGKIAVSRALYTALNVIEVATLHKFDIVKAAKVYFNVGREFNLVWFRDQIANNSNEGYWNILARLSLRDELDFLQRNLSVSILQSNKKEPNVEKIIQQFTKLHERSVARWNKIIEMLHATTDIDYTTFFVALRELADLFLAR